MARLVIAEPPTGRVNLDVARTGSDAIAIPGRPVCKRLSANWLFGGVCDIKFWGLMWSAIRFSIAMALTAIAINVLAVSAHATEVDLLLAPPGAGYGRFWQP